MTRIAILSDIHGNLAALDAVVADAEARRCTGFVNLGDSLSGPLWPAETADWLMARDWPTIAGNHERQLLTRTPDPMFASDAFTLTRIGDAHRAWLSAQPGVLAYSEDLFLCHGSPSDDMCFMTEELTETGLRAAAPERVAERLGARREPRIACGHSHLPRLVARGGGQAVVNPGSVGLQAYSDTPEITAATGSPDARYAIVEGANVSLMTVAYDHRRAADKAAREGFAGWAHALATGWNA